MLDGTRPPGVPPVESPVPSRLGGSERAVLGVLVEAPGRVLSRGELARRAGLRQLSERRVDAVMVTLRRILGDDSISTVRRRGWMLERDRVPSATQLLTER
jgi:DNA-binding response OmpR family regulator